MNAVEKASDIAAEGATAQAPTVSAGAGKPVRGSRMCSPCSARPDPLSDSCRRRT